MSKRETFLDPAKEAQAAAALREGLATMDANDDEDLVLGTIEGETSLFEAIDAVLERMAAADMMIEGADAIIGKLDARKTRYVERNKRDRALLEQAMSIADLSKVERPAATLSLSARAPSLQVTEESEIPAKYWKPAAPTLDKKALTADLKDRAKAIEGLPDDPAKRAAALANLPDIPGATLSNGAPSITIRRA